MPDPNFHEDGALREISRIEFEPMADARFRWTLWSGDVRVHSEVGNLETLPGLLEATAIFCGGMPYVEKSKEEISQEDQEKIDAILEAGKRQIQESQKAGTGEEIDPLSGGLDSPD